MIIRESKLSRYGGRGYGRYGFGGFGEETKDGSGSVPWGQIIDAGGNVLSHLFDSLGPPDVINNTYTSAPKEGMSTQTLLMVGGGALAVVALTVVLATRR